MEPPTRKGSGVFVLRERVLGLPAYVASLAPSGVEDARRLLSLTSQGATAIEWRLDLAREPISVARLLDLHRRGRPLDLQLWTLMSFELWCRAFLDQRPVAAAARASA